MWWPYLILIPPAAYQGLAICAELHHLVRRNRIRAQPPVLPGPGVSVLKPLRGLDPNTRAAFVSQIQQKYRPFEILFGVRDEADPAISEVRRLQAEYPDSCIKLFTGGPQTANGKVGVLLELSRHARYPIWVINDSDILVSGDYLASVTAPLADPGVGVVTCLYRASAHTLAAAWESLGIATDFMPSTLVAPLTGVREFGLGSTLAFRAADLASVGGFAAFSDYLADDYQLSKRITQLGRRTLLSHLTVETSLGEATWKGIWKHQLRWARTIRASKGAAYSGLFITHAGLWMAALVLLRGWPLALLLGLLRMSSALLAARFVLRDSRAQRFFWLAPLWDLYAFCIWIAAHLGDTVQWRDTSLRIDRDGRIIEATTISPK